MPGTLHKAGLIMLIKITESQNVNPKKNPPKNIWLEIIINETNTLFHKRTPFFKANDLPQKIPLASPPGLQSQHGEAQLLPPTPPIRTA